MKVVIAGTGMYMCGRADNDFGTILPAVMQARLDGLVDAIQILGRSQGGVVRCESVSRQIASMLGHDYRPSVHRANSDEYFETLGILCRSSDVLIVCLPDHLHHRAASVGIEHNCHVLVVKPLVPDLKSAKELVALSEGKQLLCCVEFHKRLDHQAQIARTRIRSGGIGEVLHVTVDYSQQVVIPRDIFSNWRNKTNIFQYLGAHYVDLIQYLTGAVPKSLTATGQKALLRDLDDTVYDLIATKIEWELPNKRSFYSDIVTSWVDPVSSPVMSIQEMKVRGTEGYLDCNQYDRGFSICQPDKFAMINPDFCQFVLKPSKVDEYRWIGYGISSILNFLECCHSSHKHLFLPTFKQSLANVAVCEAVMQSVINSGKQMSFEQY